MLVVGKGQRCGSEERRMRGCMEGGVERALVPVNRSRQLTYIGLNDQLGTNWIYSYWEQSRRLQGTGPCPPQSCVPLMRTTNASPVRCIVPLHNTVVSHGST